jgi:hypothetical protein
MEAIMSPRVLDSLHMKVDDVRRTCRIANCKMQGIKSFCDNIMMLSTEQAFLQKTGKADQHHGNIKTIKGTGIQHRVNLHSRLFVLPFRIISTSAKQSLKHI